MCAILLAPFVWLQGLSSSLVSIDLFAVGFLLLLGQESGFMLLQAVVTLAIATAVTFGSHSLTLYYPVLINGGLLIVWFYSWYRPPTIIERLAPSEDVVVDKKRAYMRRLTLVWCGIFLVNLVMSLVTTLSGHLDWWLLWNGLIAYLLVGVFAGGEYIYRTRVHRYA